MVTWHVVLELFQVMEGVYGDAEALTSADGGSDSGFDYLQLEKEHK